MRSCRRTLAVERWESGSSSLILEKKRRKEERRPSERVGDKPGYALVAAVALVAALLLTSLSVRAFDAVSPLSVGYMGFTTERLVVDPGDSKIVRRSHEGKAS